MVYILIKNRAETDTDQIFSLIAEKFCDFILDLSSEKRAGFQFNAS